MNKIPIKLYYKEDGSILNQGGLNKIPLLTKLSNYVYELILVTPLIDSEYTLYAIFEKSDGTITSPYPMDYYGTEIVKVGNQQQRWYKYKTILDSDVLNISTLNYNNQIKIGFRAEFNSGEVDEQTNESIVGVFNFIPTSAYCSYTINSRNVVIDNTPLKTIIDFINTGNAGKIEKSESILLTDVEPTLITDEGSPYYNLNYLYFFTSDTQNYKKGEIAKHTLNDNNQSVLEKIPLYESVYSKYDDTQKSNPTPRSIGERFGDVSNNLNLLHQTKVDKVEGKQLSTNDFTDAYKNKLETLDGNISVDLESTKTELKSYTDTKIADLINGSPETLDTLKELADAYQNNLDIINSLIAVLGNKANASDVYTKTQSDEALRNKVDKVNGKSLVSESEIQKLKTVEYNANNYVLPSDVPHDSNYVHTDNNFTNTEKQKLQALKNYDDSGIKQQINNVEANAKQYTNEQINELIGGASDSYNTLKELQDAFSENKDLIANLNELASKKVDKVDGKGLSTNDFTNEDKETLKYSAIPIYLNDYNHSSNELIMGAINYTHENGLKSKMFFADGQQDDILLVANRFSNYYQVINFNYLQNSKVVYNVVPAPVTDTSLITISSEGQMVETSGTGSGGSGGSGGSVDLSEVKSYIDEELGKIVDNAPEALNTLNELATAYTEQGEVVEALNSAINNKVDKVEGKQLSSNDYTDYDMEKVSIIPISIPYAGYVSGAIKEALNYMKLNNLMFLSAIYDNDFTTKIKIYPSGPSSLGLLGWNMEYKSANLRFDSNNLVTYDTPIEEITYTEQQIIPIPTKTSELENDSGFVTKNIIPNELNSKFAISSSTEDLTANTIKTRTDIGTSFIVRSMAYGNDTYVAVGQYANIRYLYKNSPTWGECDVSYNSSNSTFISVAYGKGMFVCVEYYEENGEKNSILHKSLDGIEWEQVHHFNFGIENIIYANGRFILVGSKGYISFTDDLITFTPTNSKIENDIISVTYGKNRYVAVSNKGDILYSLDGVVWNFCSIPNDTTHYRVATYGKGMFVIGGQNGTIRYSYDGISWNTAIVNSNLKSINYIRAMCYYNGKFFACLYGSGASGTDGEILTSVDGINWTSDLIDETNRLWAIGFGNELVLIGGDNGAIHKYNLNIEWLDYEPKIKSNQVLWQKQFLTLSDGSIVESEVEVHTNIKQIYEETLYGDTSFEYPLEVGLNLDNKTIKFNKEFKIPFDGTEKEIVILEIKTSYLEENTGYKNSGKNIVYRSYEDHYTIDEDIYYYEDFYGEYNKTLCDNGNWIDEDEYYNDSLIKSGWFISSFDKSFLNLFKIVDTPKSLKDRILSLEKNKELYIIDEFETGQYVGYVLSAIKYCDENYAKDFFSVTFKIKDSSNYLVVSKWYDELYCDFYDFIFNKRYEVTVKSNIIPTLDEIRENTTQYIIVPNIPGEPLKSNNLQDALDEIIEKSSWIKTIFYFSEYGDYANENITLIYYYCKFNGRYYDRSATVFDGNEIQYWFANVDGKWFKDDNPVNFDVTKVELGNRGKTLLLVGSNEVPSYKCGTTGETSDLVTYSELNVGLENKIDGILLNEHEYIDALEEITENHLRISGIYYRKNLGGELPYYIINYLFEDNGFQKANVITIDGVEQWKCIWDMEGNYEWKKISSSTEPQIINVAKDYTFDEYFCYNIDLSQNGKYLLNMSGMPENDNENGIYYIARLDFGYMKNYNVGKLVNTTYGNIDAMHAGFDGEPSYIEIAKVDAPIVFVEVEDYCVRIYGSAES